MTPRHLLRAGLLVVILAPRVPAAAAAAPSGSGDVASQSNAKRQLHGATTHHPLKTDPPNANQATEISVNGGPSKAVTNDALPAARNLPKPPRWEAQFRPKSQAPSTAPVAPASLSQEFARRIQRDPRDMGLHLDYQLARFVNGEPVPDVSALAALPQEDRELLTVLLDGLSDFRAGITAEKPLLSAKVQPLVELAERVGGQSELAFSNFALCTKVKQFGVYERLDAARFPSGEPHPVVLYCELANFASQLNSADLWETKLRYEVMLYTDSDRSLQVWQQPASPLIDQCRSRRRDFFIAQIVELPKDLMIGAYLLKVSIVDLNANRIAEATTPLQVVAKAAAAPSSAPAPASAPARALIGPPLR